MRVPGVPPAMAGVDFPFSWMVEVREKYGAKHPYGYWVAGGGSVDSREKVAEHIRIYYPHVEALSIKRQKTPPECKLIPVRPTHYQYGLHPRFKHPTDQFSDPVLTGEPGPAAHQILVPIPAKLEGIRVAKIEPLTLKPIGLTSLMPLTGMGRLSY